MWTAFIERVDGNVLPWVVVCAATLIAAVTDVRTRRIHNLLTVPLFVAGLYWAAATGGVPRVVESLLASAALGFPFLVLFVCAKGGAGDAKLMMAIGPWTGLAGGLLVLAAVSIAGLLLAIGYAIAQRKYARVASNIGAIASSTVLAAHHVIPWQHMRRTLRPSGNMAHMHIPYGVAICAGTWITAGTVLWITP